ncbi:MAG: ferritin-like domain-containing protein [Sphingobacteriales bacterium]|nr:MAG: ferritin-like domain-containing protein [Sphingobacteriales bacterium]
MNIKNILSLIQETDPEVYERLSPRRHILKSFSSKVAVAAVPFALGSLFKKAYGKTNDILYDVLTYALKYEYLEREFYKTFALQSPSLTPEATAMFTKIAADEAAHVDFLTRVIDETGSYVIPMPQFDFSGGNGTGNGPYKEYITSFPDLLQMAQAIEDLSVRTYKGLAIESQANNDIVTYMMSLQSVEARHAARIRMMRASLNYSKVKPWVYGNLDETVEARFNKFYENELNTTQNGIPILNINGYDVDKFAAAEAFDEPMNKFNVDLIINQFIVTNP